MTLTRTPLGGRYSLERPLLSSRDERHWMAIEVATGRLVLVAICESGKQSSLLAARGVTHRHLSSLIDVVREIPTGTFPDRVKVPAGAVAGVAEHVPGRTLRAVLEDGPLHAAKAVAWVLRLADAVQALHAVGSVHGAISPRSVLAAPEGRAIAPVLSQLMAPVIGAFCPPERLRGAAEAPTDDVWALYATLYAALTGKAPFSGSTRDALQREMSKRPAPLSTFGVEEPALQEITAHGLVAERRARAADLAELVEALDGWERNPKMLPPPAPPPRPAAKGLGDIVDGIAFSAAREDGIVIDDGSLPDDQGRSADFPDDELATVMAKLPAAMLAGLAAAAARPATGSSPRATAPANTPAQVAPQAAAAPTPPKRLSLNPFARKRSLVPWVAAAVVLGGGVGYLLLAPKPEPDPESRAPAEARPALARPAPKPIAKKDPDVARDECVVAHFPQSSFEGQPDFSFVCKDGDFRETTARLHAMVIVKDSADAGDASIADAAPGLSVNVARADGARDGGAPGPRLGWYELPATAIIRKTCCPTATPIVLPETRGRCEQIQTVVRRLADDSAKSVDLAPGERNFDKTVGCIYAQHLRHGYGYERPTPVNRALFQQFLSRAAIIGTRR
jgi:hypothetical protein